MIDLHCHILPGVDDGAGTPEETVRMLEEAARAQVSAIAATPHNQRNLTAYHELLEEWRPRAAACGIELLAGMEYDYGFIAEAKRLNGDIVLQGLHHSHFLLVDFAMPQLPLNWENTLTGADSTRQTRILIAHPERLFVQSTAAAHTLSEAGCFLQINAGSVLGKYGAPVRRMAFALLDAGLCHLVAGDAHRGGRRQWGLAEAAELLTRHYGAECVRQWTQSNPERILRGQNPEPVTPKRSWLKRWFPMH